MNSDKQLCFSNTELQKQSSPPKKVRAAAPLQDSEKRCRRIFASVKDGIMILDADTGKVVDVNPSPPQLPGYPGDEHIRALGVFKDSADSRQQYPYAQTQATKVKPAQGG
ncbi:MAG: PAS domain-containing protein [Deltaproteobacteria bacterium]|nr:PAS domain-containing protein [Deltaproteobacteria bacterium]